jgi:hypothetical protein
MIKVIRFENMRWNASDFIAIEVDFGDIKEVKQGEKKFSFIKLGQYDMQRGGRIISMVDMPLWIISGSEDGPTLCVTAGCHAMEYPGIVAVIRLCKSLSAKELRGTLIAVPVINMAAFKTRTPYVNPMDNKNLNRFRANPNGTISEVILYVLQEEIIKKGNYHIDLHCGDFPFENQIPCGYTYFQTVGNEKIDATSEALARIYGFELIADLTSVQEKEMIQEGKLHKGRGGICGDTVNEIPTIIPERGRMGTMEESDIVGHVEGMKNVMKYLGMLDGSPTTPVKQEIVRDRWEIMARESGLVYLKVKPGDRVEKGQVLGEIGDIQGTIVETLTAPQSGLIRLIFNYKFVNSGEMLITAFITEPLEK